MTRLTKKLTAAFLALIAALCLTFGVLLALPRAAAAAETLTEADLITTVDDKDSSKITITGVNPLDADKKYSVTIPANVTSISSNAFRNCGNIVKITYNATALKNSTINSPFAGIGNAEVEIGAITSLPAYLFYNTDIRSVVFSGANIVPVNFGQHAFDNCKKLVSVDFGNSTIDLLKNDTFNGCVSLSKVTLPSALKTIDVRAFSGCTNLLEIDIPSTVATIDATAFTNCTGLVEVRNNSTVDFNDITKLNVKHVYKPGTAGTQSWFFDAPFVKQVSSGVSKTYNYRFYTEDIVQNSATKYLVGYTSTETDIYLPDTAITSVGLTQNITFSNYTIKKGTFRNSPITSVNIPHNVDAIEADAFYGCASLKTVTFENTDKVNGISTIADETFFGCTSLERIVIPASVGTIGGNAFNGCTSLAEVEFAYVNNTTSNLKDIQVQAFANCTSLTEIEIPETVNFVRGQAFSGCTNLVKAVLPKVTDARNPSITVSAFEKCNAELVLVAPNYTSYNYYKTNASGLQNLAYQLTFELHYGNSNEGKEVTQLNTDDMPAWEGYKTSVWYNTTDHSGTPVTKDNLPKTDEVHKLYTPAMAKPTEKTFVAKTQIYSNEISLDTQKETIFEVKDEKFSLADYKFVVTKYLDMTEANKTDPKADNTKVKDAGSYEIAIQIADEGKYGQWSEFTKISLKINPAYVPDHTILEWVVGGNPLSDHDALYVDDDDNVSVDKVEGVTPISVKKSVINYTGNEITVKLNGDGKEGSFITDVEYIDGFKGTGHGKYTATATVRLDNNHWLQEDVYGDKNEALAGQGITITRDSITNTFTVTKVWYIVADNVNRLVVSENNGAVYSINGWRYNSNGLIGTGSVESVALPYLQYNNDKINDLVSYTLTMYESETAVGENPLVTIPFTHSMFSKVINGTMPAGYYVLSVSILDTEEGGKEVVGTGDKPITIKFTVEKGLLDSLSTRPLPENGVGVYADYNSTNPKNQIGDVTPLIPVYGLKEQIHPSRDKIQGNEWAKSEHAHFYTGFSLTYSLRSNGTYYDVNDEEFIKPIEIGNYEVYYRISAPSYDDSVNDSPRYYVLYIRGVVEPAFRTIPYAGKGVRVTVPDTDYYEVIYLDDSNTSSAELRRALGIQDPVKYDRVGGSPIVLKIKDRYANTARWKSNNDGLAFSDPKYNDRYFAYRLEIVKANNYGTQTPTMVSWEWGTYNPDVNVPHWATAFDATDDITYNFYISTLADGMTNKYYVNPTGEQLSIFDAPAGEYYLIPIANGTDNVNGWEPKDSSGWGTVTILKVSLRWKTDDTPFINSWKYGEDPASLSPKGTLDVSSEEFAETLANTWEVKIVLQKDYEDFLEGNVAGYDSLKALQDANGGCVPANNYVYVYHLESTANYDVWYYPVNFTVIRATNYWDIAPVINNWSYGEYTSLGTCKPHFGDAKAVSVEICKVLDNGDREGWESINELLDSNNQLPMGKYEYRVTLRGNSNYTDLTFDGVQFEVFKGQNGWNKIPQIIGWAEGRFNYKDENKVSNAPVAEAQFGNVYYTVISDATGNTVIERISADLLNYETLNKLAVGSYTLRAEVDGTVNYDGLVAEAHFAVFEDSVGLTGLIASTMVFAVIAVGLAVAGVVLLIRRNKKIEQEFRNMVKTELRRK